MIGNKPWTYQVPEKLGAFDTTVQNTAGELLRTRRIAEQEEKIEEFEMFRDVMAGLKEQILFAVDEQYLQALKQLLVNYAGLPPLGMLMHLFDNCTLGRMD